MESMASPARPFSPRDWEHHLVVLTYTGCVFDTSTQKAKRIECICWWEFDPEIVPMIRNSSFQAVKELKGISSDGTSQ